MSNGNLDEMLIHQVYIKFNKQLIILVSGINGCGKGFIAKKIAENFDLEFIDQFNFLDKSYNTKVKVKNEEVIDWESKSAVDWKKFNEKINEKKDKGVVVSGFYLADEYLDFKPDFHLHVSLSKQSCFKKRSNFLEENKDNINDKLIKKELIKFNKLTYPNYLDARENSTINKFLNANELSFDKLFYEAFDYLINNISKYLQKKN